MEQAPQVHASDEQFDHGNGRHVKPQLDVRLENPAAGFSILQVQGKQVPWDIQRPHPDTQNPEDS